jgi:hypothetical protein
MPHQEIIHGTDALPSIHEFNRYEQLSPELLAALKAQPDNMITGLHLCGIGFEARVITQEAAAYDIKASDHILIIEVRFYNQQLFYYDFQTGKSLLKNGAEIGRSARARHFAQQIHL